MLFNQGNLVSTKMLLSKRALGTRPLESLNGHTFRFCWTVQDLEIFSVSSDLPLKGLNVLQLQ